MPDIRLTIRNYRCFGESEPLTIDIGRCITAMIGPNNSGKSSLLKFFYEFRLLWTHLESALPAALTRKFTVPFPSVEDPEEVFSNTNLKPLIIDIELKSVTENDSSGSRKISRLVCRVERPSGTSQCEWRCVGYADDGVEIPAQGPFSWRAQFQSINAADGKWYDCAALVEGLKAFSEVLYIGPFRNAINEGGGLYYDLAVGASFISTWNSWKAGATKEQNRAVERVTSDILHIFDFKSLEINASQDQKTLAISVDGKPYRLRELGAGLAQFIIVLGNAAIRKPSIVLVDEPELNLHPSLQIDFLTSLASYAKYATIFATHSIGLARATADRIYSFQRMNERSSVRPFEQTPNYPEFVGEMSFSSFKEIGCDRILLVEGVSDVKTIQQFLRQIKKDHRVVIIPLGGDQLAREGTEIELAELKRISNNVSALVDSERNSEGDPPKRERAAFSAICQKLSIDICTTQRRAIENYLSDHAIKQVFGHKYRELLPYESLKDVPLRWSKSDNWKIARQMTFSEIKNTDIGGFLERL